jgi:mRNA-degrading endonuclease RelE of RelBE toxin-antitoxin system
MSIEPTFKLFFSDRFKKDVTKLGKRYRSIRLDLQPLIEQLEACETPGDRISDTDHVIFKIRVKNSSIQKGKSGGYRVIYYVKTNIQIILLTMYSKSDQSSINASEVRKIIIEAEAQLIGSEISEPTEFVQVIDLTDNDGTDFS